ncbi:putative CsbD family protein (plasmid) [Pararobbsia alpina]|uniref:hypothetical protein n=1 Tax=Pararobbsia alpina TaxID=621374 RepID=UPI0039A6CB79
MNSNQVEGAVQMAAGTVEGVVADAIGDAPKRVTATMREMGGRAQKTFGDYVEALSSMTQTHPLGILAIGVAAGFFVGALLARSHE